MEKIFALNLTARADKTVAGNPVTTRLESGVGNCFPGLEFDHRNLDRRFFPGLIFNFGTSPGVPLVGVDVDDPDLDPATFEAPDANAQRVLRTALRGQVGRDLQQANTTWVLDSIQQKGISISLRTQPGLTAWRLVRSLEAGEVEIVLALRGGNRTIPLTGWRRTFVNPKTGVISGAFQAGELTQSLCSPWMHDFRDCVCTYWASNHPDIVLAEQAPGVEPDPDAEETPIDWLRSDRASLDAAAPTEEDNREGQMDHYEINLRWQDLAIVLAGHEITSVFTPRVLESANPFETADALADELMSLAELEHAVALEYLYAMFSIRNPTEVAGQELQEAVEFVSHEMLVIAVSEMRHLRWANQLIWELEHAGLTTKPREPSLGVARQIPGKEPGQLRDRALSRLTPDRLDEFIAVEKPSGTLDGEYARVLATLRQPKYGDALEQLAERILADGMEHYTRFRQIQRVLKPFQGDPERYLRTLTPATKTQAQAALTLYDSLVGDLREAYRSGDMEDASRIASARAKMFGLRDAAEALANGGKGVPFF